MNAVIIILALVFIEIMGLYYMKIYSIHKSNIYYVIAVLFYAVSIYLVANLMKSDKLAVINSAWNVIQIIIGLVIGYFLFSEMLNTKQAIGIGVAMVGMVLLI
jgi:multidrug transporter EmrE-like cation transporter